MFSLISHQRLYIFFAILILSYVSCATKKDKTFTSRKAGESFSLVLEERVFGTQRCKKSQNRSNTKSCEIIWRDLENTLDIRKFLFVYHGGLGIYIKDIPISIVMIRDIQIQILEGGALTDRNMKNKMSHLFNITILVITIFLFAFSQSSKGELVELQKIFGVSKVHATYVVVIDTSSTMRPYWQEVKNALSIFTTALPTDDHLSLIVFDNQATTILSENITQGKSSLLNVLPPEPKGQKTDIGRAIKKSIDEFEKSKNKIGFLLFLTDGKDEPPDDSEFTKQPNVEWKNLRERGSKIIREKSIEIYAIGLKEGADIGKLSDVFGSEKVSLLTKSSSQLRSYFQSAKDELLKQKLLGQVKQELDEGYISIVPSESKYEMDKLAGSYTISSSYRLLKVETRIEGINVDKLDIPKEGRLNKESFIFSIKNAALLLEQQSTSKPIDWVAQLKEVERGFDFGLHRRTYNGELKVAISAVVQPANEIEEIGLKPKGNIKVQTIPISFSPRIFIPIWAVGIVVITIPIVVLIIIKINRRKRRLFGWLTFSESPPGQQLPLPVKLSDYLDEAIVGRVGQITLYGQKVSEKHARFFRDKKDMKIEPVSANQIRVNDKVIFSAHMLSSGDTLNVGDYTATWVR